MIDPSICGGFLKCMTATRVELKPVPQLMWCGNATISVNRAPNRCKLLSFIVIFVNDERGSTVQFATTIRVFPAPTSLTRE